MPVINRPPINADNENDYYVVLVKDKAKARKDYNTVIDYKSILL